MEKNKLHIDLLDTSFSILVDEDKPYLEKLLGNYRVVLENTGKAIGIGKDEPVKLAIITGLLLCDEIEKMKNKRDNDDKEMERRTLDMIARIDRLLPVSE